MIYYILAAKRTCPEPSDHKCDRGRCLPNYLLCDKVRQCSDGSDEDLKICGECQYPKPKTINFKDKNEKKEKFL